ncbi:LGFP repeat-containing protein [Sphaerisporangium aureirubrum]
MASGTALGAAGAETTRAAGIATATGGGAVPAKTAAAAAAPAGMTAGAGGAPAGTFTGESTVPAGTTTGTRAAPAGTTAGPRAAPADAKRAADCETTPTGVFEKRWKELDARRGPMRCPKGEPVGVPGGTALNFENGQMVHSPGQGGEMVVAAYSQDDNIIVNWGPTTPFHYDKFLVRWDRGDVNLGQVTVDSYIDRDRGFYAIPVSAKGRYRIVVEGCDNKGGSTCRQSWTAPAFVDHEVPVPRFRCHTDPPTGAIGQRWAYVGGGEGAIGCPTGAERDVTGGKAMSFAHGEIVHSPAQGPDMAVAVYQDGGTLHADWGDTRPFHYDRFLVRWDLNGRNVGQTDVDADTYAKSWSGHWSTPVGTPGRYTVIVEGCDGRTLQSSSCKQKWTIPASVQVTFPDPKPPSQDCPIRPVTKLLLDRWVMTGAKTGPLGCPTGEERVVQAGRSMPFQHGTIVTSPKQGTNMTVAVYQRDVDLVVDWGDTYPFSYDHFLIRVDRAGRNLGQVEVDPDDDEKERWGSRAIRPRHYDDKDEDDPIVDSVGTYSVIVEGCDGGGLGSDDCNQGWTVPAEVPYIAKGHLDFSKIPVPRTAQEAYAVAPERRAGFERTYTEERVRVAAAHIACPGPMPLEVFNNEDNFVTTALAKLYMQYDDHLSDSQLRCDGIRFRWGTEVNNALRLQTIKSNAGTESGFPCKREGEYDVALKGYVLLAYAFESALDPDVRYRLLHLLNKRGPHNPGDDTICGLLNVDESENHRLLIETSRYLTNQLLARTDKSSRYDNARNGMNTFMLKWLQSFLKNDFIEYNARPYQRYSLAGIQNLYDMAEDKRVKLAAQMVLDYASAKYAVSANDGRRDSPFRRLTTDWHPDLFHSQSDALRDRMMAYFGPTAAMGDLDPPGFVPASSAGEILLAGISQYRPPEMIADLVLNHEHRSFFQRITHAGIEVYSAEPDFLITAGGAYTGPAYKVAGRGRSVDSGTVVPTTLMPTGHLVSTEQMIRISTFLGNGCVAPGFACGAGVVIPDHYLRADRPQCWIRKGQWVFVDAATAGCTDSGRGFYVAARRSANGNEIGFFEAVPKTVIAGVPLADFARRTLDRNEKRSFGIARSEYTKWDGTVVVFARDTATPQANTWNYSVVRTGVPQIDKVPWSARGAGPLAAGTVINSRGHTGYVTVDNPALGTRLTLDFTRALDPARTEGRGP